MVQLQRLIDYLSNEVFNIQLSQLIFQELVQFAYILCTGLSQERAEAQKAKTFRIAFFLRAKTFWRKLHFLLLIYQSEFVTAFDSIYHLTFFDLSNKPALVHYFLVQY